MLDSDPEGNWKLLRQPVSKKIPLPTTSILIIYTGGTIGAVPSDSNDPKSPLGIEAWDKFRSRVPEIDTLADQYKLQIDAVYFTTPLDSTNIALTHWKLLVDIIVNFYHHDYIGFVILHGTDTMVYTASALSFMLEGLTKPVIITGSQVPIIDHPGSDGVRNLVNAIKIAAGPVFGLPVVREVCIAFDKVLLRGNRARKVGADNLAGFESPNFPPLGRLEADIVINKSLLWHPRNDFNPRRRLDANVILLQLFPGIQDSEVLPQCFASPSLRAVVLLTYGTGNAPTSDTFLNTIERAIKDNKKIILDVTQCLSGSVKLGQYETGIGLMMRGVFGGADITPESALCKLMWVLGANLNPREQLLKSVAGEQSENLYWSDLKGDPPVAVLATLGARVNLSHEEGYNTSWDKEAITGAVLHLHGARIDGLDKVVQFEVYIDLDPELEPTHNHSGFCGTISKATTVGPAHISFDVLKGIGALQPGRPPKITLILKTQADVSFHGASLLVFSKA